MRRRRRRGQQLGAYVHLGFLDRREAKESLSELICASNQTGGDQSMHEHDPIQGHTHTHRLPESGLTGRSFCNYYQRGAGRARDGEISAGRPGSRTGRGGGFVRCGENRFVGQTGPSVPSLSRGLGARLHGGAESPRAPPRRP